MNGLRVLTVLTWGYSRDRSFEDLLAALPEDLRRWVNVGIVDVRRSRGTWNPHWRGSKWNPPAWVLERELMDWALRYTWLWALGNSKDARPGEWEPCGGLTDVDRQLGILESRLRELGAVVIICAEGDPRPGTRFQCHRVAVAAEPARRTGATITHLGGPNAIPD